MLSKSRFLLVSCVIPTMTLLSGCGSDGNALDGPSVKVSPRQDASSDSSSDVAIPDAGSDSSGDTALPDTGSDASATDGSSDAQSDPCLTDQTCQNQHRACINNAGTASCGDCLAGYHVDGTSCVPDQSCTASTCGGAEHGTCDDSSGVPICTCKPNYAGEHCDTCASGSMPSHADANTCVASPCASDPCSTIPHAKAGSCQAPSDTTFQCACEDGRQWDAATKICQGCFDLDGDKVNAGPDCTGRTDCNDHDPTFDHPGQVVTKERRLSFDQQQSGSELSVTLPYKSTQQGTVSLDAKYNAVAPTSPNTKVLVPLAIEASFYGAEAGTCYEEQPPVCSSSNDTWTKKTTDVGPMPRFPGEYQIVLHPYAGQASTTCADATKWLEGDNTGGLEPQRIGKLTVHPATKCATNHYELRAVSWSSGGISATGGDISASPSAWITLNIKYRIAGVDSQLGNIHQLVIGTQDDSLSCLQLYQLPKCKPNTTYKTGTWKAQFRAPSVAGTYQLRAKHTQQYTCKYSNYHPNDPGALGAYDNSPPPRGYTFAILHVK